MSDKPERFSIVDVIEGGWQKPVSPSMAHVRPGGLPPVRQQPHADTPQQPWTPFNVLDLNTKQEKPDE